ncbi:MAG: hypothetical protein NTV52_14160 [Acidobacteria bacterium]|nr:hypothetical protein [Acidobacteriota bacterium]
MAKKIQLRDVQDALHRTLKARAAREGISLSALIKRHLEHLAERPSMREWLLQTQAIKTIPTHRTPAQVIREMRDER